MPQDQGTKGSQQPGMKGIGERLAKGMGGAYSPPPSSSGPSPAEQERAALQQRASSLGSRLSSLRGKASMSDLRSSLVQLDTTLRGFPALLEEIRRGGYVYKAYLEKKTGVLRQQWQDLGQRIDTEAAQQSRMLVPQVDMLQQRLSAMGINLQAFALDALERDIAAMEGRVSSSYSGVEGLFSTLQQNAGQTERQLKGIQWMMQELAGASFRLRTEENLVEALEAQYLTEQEKDGPKGILFLTDQRLLFEQKEDVATKKFLFITTQKERVQKLLLEAPIGSAQARASQRGALMFKKELLELGFSGGQAPVSQALFRLKTDSDTCQALIGRIQTGDIAGERVGAPAVPAAPAAPAAAAPAAVAAPTTCPTCGANITTEIVRGMQSISCEYCGTVIRL